MEFIHKKYTKNAMLVKMAKNPEMPVRKGRKAP